MAKEVKIGEASYGRSKKKFFKLKEGESTFRILPPLGDLAEDGKWSMYYKIHYGYKNAEGKARPFQSSLVVNRNTKMIESPDAACERIDQFKAELDVIKKTKPLNKARLEAITKLVGGPKSIYNLDNNHYLNVIDEQGNIGVLKLRHKAKNALDMTINELREKGIDPLSPYNGRFFVFHRTGLGLDTTFKVTIKKRQITVDGVGEVEQDIIHKLDDSIIKRLGNEAAELDKLFKVATSDQIARIVAESELATGISPNIESILGFSSKGGSSAAPEEEYEDDTSGDEVAAPAPVQTAPAPKLESPLAKAPEAKPAPKAEPAMQTTANKVEEMSDDEFMKSLGLN